MFRVEYRREIRCPRVEVFEAARDENYFRPVAVLFRKYSAKKTKKRWEDEHRILYIAVDVHAIWKKVKCMFCYSTGTEFVEHLLNSHRNPSILKPSLLFFAYQLLFVFLRHTWGNCLLIRTCCLIAEHSFQFPDDRSIK